MEFEYSWQNISEAHGVALSLIGMAIVFASLTLISIFIRSIPAFFGFWEGRKARRTEGSVAAPEATAAGRGATEDDVPDDVLVAIAAVIDHELRRPDGSAPLRLTLHRSSSFWERAGRMRSLSAHDLSQR